MELNASDQYLYFWCFYFAASVVLLYSAWHLTAVLYFGLLRQISITALMVLLWTPSFIPGYDDDYAPAFLIAGFETFFQNPGQPEQAVNLLRIVLAVCIGLLLFFRLGIFRFILGLFRSRDPFARL